MGEMNRLAIQIHAQQDSRSSQSEAPQEHEEEDDTYDEPSDLFARTVSVFGAVGIVGLGLIVLAVTVIVKAMQQLAQG
jgi:predicted cobalt transporter CbtA